MPAQLDALLAAIPLTLRPASAPFAAETFVHHNGQAPADYLDAFTRYRGGAGQVGMSYVDIWEPEEVQAANVAYETAEYAPGFTIFASDGGGTAYAFEQRSGHIYVFPFIGMTIEKPATFLNTRFEGFLADLAERESD